MRWPIERRTELSRLKLNSCVLKFNKWMRCNEKSEIKLSNASFVNGTWTKYDCIEELNELDEWCITYHFRVLFEQYFWKYTDDYGKFQSTRRMNPNGQKYKPESTKKLYY